MKSPTQVQHQHGAVTKDAAAKEAESKAKEVEAKEAEAKAKEAATKEAEAKEAAAKEAESKAKAEAKTAAKEAEAKEAEATKKPPFYVEDGKALTTKRGILSDGDEIKAEDLAGGKKALTAFVKTGHVGKG